MSSRLWGAKVFGGDRLMMARTMSPRKANLKPSRVFRTEKAKLDIVCHAAAAAWTPANEPASKYVKHVQ